EYRYYQMPGDSPILALLGEKWRQNYGRDVDYLHFHNFLEIGFCYEGEGTLTFGEDILPFHGREFTVIPRNFPHTTDSVPGNISYWE
ncbi:AraC family ligand binding domain-containing protein, partial [Acinetobacter baumannii]|nr:AraC family ligand binding domain-containing protein [Acinetobacter baumannii]